MTIWDRVLDNNIERAKGYIRSYGEGVDFPSRMEVLNWVKPDESFLDVGCGSGCEFENMIVHDKPPSQYTGLDYAPTFIAACKELFPEKMFPRASWMVGSAESLPFMGSSFDTVLLRHVLELLPYYESAIEEAWRVAKKRVILVFWIPPEDKPDLLRFKETDTPQTFQANRYNLPTLMSFLSGFTKKITVKENVGKSNMVIVMEKI